MGKSGSFFWRGGQAKYDPSHFSYQFLQNIGLPKNLILWKFQSVNPHFSGHQTITKTLKFSHNTHNLFKQCHGKICGWHYSGLLLWESMENYLVVSNLLGWIWLFHKTQNYVNIWWYLKRHFLNYQIYSPLMWNRVSNM